MICSVCYIFKVTIIYTYNFNPNSLKKKSKSKFHKKHSSYMRTYLFANNYVLLQSHLINLEKYLIVQDLK